MKKKLKKKNTSRKTIKKKAKKINKTSKKVSAIPKGYHSITPYLIIDEARTAIDFYKRAFKAKEVMRMELPNGKIGHAELQIGDAKIMLADEFPEMNARSPRVYGGTPVGIHLYIKNVDFIVEQAVESGAKILKPIENMFWGDRSATIEDPYGHKWTIATHIENVTPAKMKKRAKEQKKYAEASIS